jgi:hypothetical protein
MRAISIIIILIIVILCLVGIILNQAGKKPAGDWLDKIYQQINQKFINPMKQGVSKFSQKIESWAKNLLEKIKEKKRQKQKEIKEEIKQEIKEEAEKQVQKRTEKIENFLAPLKNKIQQGSAAIKESVNKIKDFLISLFKG